MKRVNIVLFIAFIVNYFNAQQNKITSYSLGETYYNLSKDDYTSYRRKCSSNSAYSVQYMITPSAKNTNTLVSQIKDGGIKRYYEKTIDKIRDWSKKIIHIGSEDCSVERFNFQKAILEYYKSISQKYAEWDNLMVDREIAEAEFYDRLEKENDRIIGEKIAENKHKIDSLNTLYNEINEGKVLIDKNCENKMASARDVYNKKIPNLENQASQKIKSLSVKDFSKNKQAILNNLKNRKNTIYSEMNNSIILIEKQCTNEKQKKSQMAENNLSTIEREIYELENYDYEALKKRDEFDGFKYNRLQTIIMKNINNIETEFEEQIQNVINNSSKNNKIVPLL